MKRWVIIAAVSLWMSWGASAQAEDTHIENLKNYTETLRNMAFSGVISSAGKECITATHSFIREEDGEGTVYVAVRCQNGEDYLILEGGSGGSRVLTCAQADAIMQGMGLTIGCWDPL